MKWIKTTEKTPDKSDYYLTCDNGEIEILYYSKVSNSFSDISSLDYGNPFPDPEYWMKLPETPNETQLD